MTTKKDFEATARILAWYASEVTQIGFAALVEEFADLYAGQNPRFDRDRFRKACQPIGPTPTPTPRAKP